FGTAAWHIGRPGGSPLILRLLRTALTKSGRSVNSIGRTQLKSPGLRLCATWARVFIPEPRRPSISGKIERRLSSIAACVLVANGLSGLMRSPRYSTPRLPYRARTFGLGEMLEFQLHH